MPKKVLALDSHGLSDFQRCPRLYKYTNILGIEPGITYEPFERGTTITMMLEAYYLAKREEKSIKQAITQIIQDILYMSSLPQDMKDLIEIRFMRYIKHYKDESWFPIAMESECAFSKILYEDSDYLFVYEGRPDMVVWLDFDKKHKLIIDHKSQSRRKDLYFYNNQVLGYSWGLDIPNFAYNYFGIQESGEPNDWFRRSGHRFIERDIAKWKLQTIHWFKKIVEDESLYPSLQCDGPYGLCAFKNLCECNEDWVMEDKIKREFKKRTFKVWQ